MTENDLKKALRSGAPAPAYVLYGEEPYLVRHYAGRIQKAAVAGHAEWNAETLDETADVRQIYNAYMAVPWMGGRKCVTVRDLSAEKVPAEQWKTLLAMLAAPNPACVLVFRFENPAVTGKTATDRFRKLVAAVESCGGAAVEFPRKTRTEAAALLRGGAEKRGCRLTPQAANRLIDLCGVGLFRLNGELEKLCAYAAAHGGEITAETADLLCPRTVEASVYDLADHLFSGRLTDALVLLDDLFFARTEPVVIAGCLADRYIDLYRVFAADKAGVPHRAAAERFGYRNRAFLFDRAARAARSFTPERVYRSLLAIADADAALKNSRCDPKITLQCLLVSLAYLRERGVAP